MQIFHPDLEAKPWWKSEDFVLAKALKKSYSTHKQALAIELRTVKSKPEAWLSSGQFSAGEAQVEVDGTVTEQATGGAMHQTFIPFTFVRSKEGSLGGWAEYPLFDGLKWNEGQCRSCPSICQAFRNHFSSLCSGAQSGREPDDIHRACGTDIVITLIRLTPGVTLLPQTGMTNRRLVLHWCLEGCDGVDYTVGGVAMKNFGGDEGSPIVFDDSFEHEVQHNGASEAYFVQAVLAHPAAAK